jgi:hypothetical protein
MDNILHGFMTKETTAVLQLHISRKTVHVLCTINTKDNLGTSFSKNHNHLVSNNYII